MHGYTDGKPMNGMKPMGDMKPMNGSGKMGDLDKSHPLRAKKEAAARMLHAMGEAADGIDPDDICGITVSMVLRKPGERSNPAPEPDYDEGEGEEEEDEDEDEAA